VRDGSPYLDISMFRNSHGSTLWLVWADSQTVSYSSDNGAHWVHDSATFRGNPVMNMLWKDSVTGYVLTFTKDSTLTFWKYLLEPSSVEHLHNAPKRFIKLPSSVVTNGKMKLLALQALHGDVKVFDALGRIVWESSIIASKSQYIDLDVPASTGVYFLQYSNGNDRQTLRYIRQ
jgi:hypothetical protein